MYASSSTISCRPTQHILYWTLNPPHPHRISIWQVQTQKNENWSERRHWIGACLPMRRMWEGDTCHSFTTCWYTTQHLLLLLLNSLLSLSLSLLPPIPLPVFTRNIDVQMRARITNPYPLRTSFEFEWKGSQSQSVTMTHISCFEFWLGTSALGHTLSSSIQRIQIGSRFAQRKIPQTNIAKNVTVVSSMRRWVVWRQLAHTCMSCVFLGATSVKDYIP